MMPTKKQHYIQEPYESGRCIRVTMIAAAVYYCIEHYSSVERQGYNENTAVDGTQSA